LCLYCSSILLSQMEVLVTEIMMIKIFLEDRIQEL
jgi:hypothetical protein